MPEPTRTLTTTLQGAAPSTAAVPATPAGHPGTLPVPAPTDALREAGGALPSAPEVPPVAPAAPEGVGQDRMNMVFALDASQRWALGTLLVLAAGLVGLLWLTLAVFTIGQSPRLDLFFLSFLEATPPAMLPWLKVGLVSLAGATLEVMWGVGYHGFWKKDFDPESIFFSAAKLAGAPFITLATFAAADLVLPSELAFFVPTSPLSPFVVGMAFLLGYHGNDLLDLVHARMTKLLGKKPAPIVSRPLPKSRVYPLDALAGHPALVGAVAGLDEAVRALRAYGAHTTSDVLALGPAQVQEAATRAGADPAALAEVQRLADALHRRPSLDEGIAEFRRAAGAVAAVSAPALPPPAADAAGALTRTVPLKRDLP